MFRIQSAQRTSRDFSVRAYQRFDADGALAPLPNVVRAVRRIAGRFTQSLMEAIYESRRKQAMTVLGCYGDLIAESQSRAPVSQESARASDTNGTSFEAYTTVAPGVYGIRIRCSITGAPCEGDRAYLCDEWGCARKGGLSPMSHENA